MALLQSRNRNREALDATPRRQALKRFQVIIVYAVTIRLNRYDGVYHYDYSHCSHHRPGQPEGGAGKDHLGHASRRRARPPRGAGHGCRRRSPGHATRWAAAAPEDLPFPAAVAGLAATDGRIHREFIDVFDFVVVDCPPSADSPVSQSALLVADLALVPVIPSPPDPGRGWQSAKPSRTSRGSTRR